MAVQKQGQGQRTTDHEAIRRWALDRGAIPATVPGTEQGEHLGVLRFDFPGLWGRELRHVTWDQFFRTFDQRSLSLVFQGIKTRGAQSNFVRFDNPNREDA